jgi:hypothetical protein
MDAHLSATLACDKIRSETADRSDERVRRTGQVAILLAALRCGTVDRFALTLMGGERGVTEAELSRHILRPLVQRGFIRTTGDAVRISVAAARHADAIGAWMDGETLDTLDAKAPVKKLQARDLKVGDVFEYIDSLGRRMLARCESKSFTSTGRVDTGSAMVYADDRVTVYRAA